MQLFGQLNPGKPVPGFATILSNMVTHDGFFSIYKGVDAAIGRQLVYGTARIGLHRTFSDKLVQMNGGNPISFVQKALSGMASGSIAVCIGTPFDIALVRLQSDGMAKPEDRRNYKNVFDVSCYFFNYFFPFVVPLLLLYIFWKMLQMKNMISQVSS